MGAAVGGGAKADQDGRAMLEFGQDVPAMVIKKARPALLGRTGYGCSSISIFSWVKPEKPRETGNQPGLSSDKPCGIFALLGPGDVAIRERCRVHSCAAN
jgi:hypothetical protein